MIEILSVVFDEIVAPSNLVKGNTIKIDNMAAIEVDVLMVMMSWIGGSIILFSSKNNKEVINTGLLRSQLTQAPPTSHENYFAATLHRCWVHNRCNN